MSYRLQIDYMNDYIDYILKIVKMNKIKLLKYIKTDTFFKDYLPEIKSYQYKIKGSNWRGNPADFSKEDQKKIKVALKKLFSKIIN